MFSTKEFIKLLGRSPDQGDGWRTISDFLLDTARKASEIEPSLFEFDEGEKRIRLTLKGEGALWALTS